MAHHATTLFKTLVLFLSLFSLANGAAIEIRRPLAPRQSPAATTAGVGTPAPAAANSCNAYSLAANLSTVATNTTLRGAFLRSTPLPFYVASAILDAQTPLAMSFMFDTALNSQCGNASAIALTEAGNNLTAGTVLGIKILPAVGVDPGNVALPILIVLFILFMGGSAMSL